MKKIMSRLRFKDRVLPMLVGALLFSPLLIDVAFAQENTTQLVLADVLSVFIHILTFFVLMIMDLGGDLIGTTFLTSDAAMGAVRPMWIFIRNLVNIGFVLVLLFLAFANLFSSLSGGQGSWTIKDKLPRIIIALIAVNFSLLVFRVAIDAVHVGTITILSITDVAEDEKTSFNKYALLHSGINNTTHESCDSPDAEFPVKPNAKSPKDGQCVPFYKYVEHSLCPTKNATTGAVLNSSDCLVKFTKEVAAYKKGDNASYADSATERNIFWAFGVHFQKLERLPLLAGKLNSFTGVVNSTLFSMVLALAYAVAWVAIFIALMVRIVMLWFFMILSPALMAAQIMGVGNSASVGSFNIQQSLVSNLIMPLKIAIAFALSFVMISTMITIVPENHTTVLEAGEAMSAFWGAETGVFSILWQIMTIVVFWMAAFWALDGSEAKFITDKIKSGTEKVGSFAGNVALDRVAAPIPSLNPKVLSRIPGQLGNALDTKFANQAAALAKPIGKAFNLDIPTITAGSQKLAQAAQKFSANSLKGKDNIRKEYHADQSTQADYKGLTDAQFRKMVETVEAPLQAGYKEFLTKARTGTYEEAQRAAEKFFGNDFVLPKVSGSTAVDTPKTAPEFSTSSSDGSISIGSIKLENPDRVADEYNNTDDTSLRNTIEKNLDSINNTFKAHDESSKTLEILSDNESGHTTLSLKD